MNRAKHFLFFFFIFLIPTLGFGQVSLVPASHQVYDWLHLQRVKGNLTNYSYEALPLTRKQILSYLDQVKKAEKLNSIDSQLLRWYYQEFSLNYISESKPNTYLQRWDSTFTSSVKRKFKQLISNEEPHLFTYKTDSLFIAMDYKISSGVMAVNDASLDFQETATLDVFQTTLYGGLYNLLGAHVDIYNPLIGKTGMLSYHPEWGQTFDGMKQDKGSTLYTEAFVSFQYKQLGIHVGNGDLKYGYSGSEAQILRKDAGNFDWFRINLDTKYIQYTLLHGTLRTNTTVIEVEGYPGVLSRFSPERWFALRRIQITPTNWFTAGFTESLIYSNRPIELSYLNPFQLLRLGEYESLDKDNPLWFFDGSIRPIRNIELYATLGVDDLVSIGDIFKPSKERTSPESSATISYQAGINVSLPTSTKLNIEVLQFDPYFYTHWQLFNSYDELGSPLGASIGPNSRQFYVSVRQWLPWRSFIDVSFESVKKGFNVVDANGELLLDVGGDIFQGIPSVNGEEVDLFAGDVHKWNAIKVKFEIEPRRGIRFFGTYRYRFINQGTQIDDLSIFYGGMEINFIPFITNVLGVIPGMNYIF